MKTTLMAQESRQTPIVIAQQLISNRTICQRLVEKINAFNPYFVYIIGRGSSDHAGVFAKYLIEVEMGIAVSSSAPSVFSIYNQSVKLDKALVIVISQSGSSPDIIAQTKAAKASGALTIALVNTPNSPLSTVVDAELPLRAGQELAIAATKSYLATLSALLQLIAYWKQDTVLLESLNHLPQQLTAAIEADAKLSHDFVAKLSHLVVLGRGFGYAVSREIALKLKEVCGIHAEAFSSAEFLHGPVTLVEKSLSIIDVAVDDESQQAHQEIMADVNSRGSCTLNIRLTVDNTHPRCMPLIILQRFYLDIEFIARQMRLDPDSPAGLKKVTKTL
ncbi:glucosamine-6-phosphate deaminase NagB-II [Paraglaciecola sp. L3A3]|uniref:glucosamine-6-phosphate deaminase NagB-II n=1 Tax=Paraglaciecola sp. L3A3 TaxID=2686358 RepID=UPI00131C0672|nr:SIS domain-containing protein [Paraglaciecola sp. L3A3]